MIYPIIMAGGSGSRLWPMSRSLYPKQFLNIIGKNTMLQDTVFRLENMDAAQPLIICNNEHRFLVAEQLRDIGVNGKIILEPEGKNTAPAIALAALKAVEAGDDPLLLVLAADHVIQNRNAFENAVSEATNLAEQNKLVTFGIVARSPESGYGYIHRGKACEGGFTVSQFVEKPDKETAQSYIDTGDYYWNSGMFMFKASQYLSELEKYQPEMLEICRKSMISSTKDFDFIRIDGEIFGNCPSESIDYAVMEKTDSAVVVPLDAGWSDIGSWSAIWDVSQKDSDGNRILGDVITHESSGCLVHGEDRLISVLGLNNVVIIDTKDAVLVADKSKVQDVKNIVSKLKSSNRDEWKIHREVYRPWGKYDSIDIGSRYQVKRISVNPGAKLSVQMHHHRAEHWVVVSGTAQVTNGDSTFLVSENESTYIPIGRIHALENPGKLPLELIEVQTGSYLGEDDIVRLDDRYGRASKSN
ncbi:mannose-1-phosphate guanylyltransferase/mannose-6-phosphate isomerase [Aliikangiella coralliicola]|uniref:mannose-1-phosphate guanylyltransferase n=1 Tax=Aliikangiella coralliicola TaxID=2592383 RepID=A0A545TSN6_9GAMM|nr:mannose-1-phosphate guanylyltransferase/mannose-6-phosphate isomerase [Aliikangiella coralliicola]TQV80233.1 mannose-1-phosphate guanylyltransferase/mannose-6-phosphate isomerase [Aliikangiella coralliicola]